MACVGQARMQPNRPVHLSPSILKLWVNSRIGVKLYAREKRGSFSDLRFYS
jgi:hypothetical protein